MWLLAIMVGFNMAALIFGSLVTKQLNVAIILGSPASGKTTLARRLAAAFGLGCLCKDDIKEALFDSLGVGDRDWSRRLSEASFAVLGAFAGAELAAGRSCIVEGNWRDSHADALRRVFVPHGARALEISCVADPQEIVRRFTLRTRHPGHLDLEFAQDELLALARRPPAFLGLGSFRCVYRSDSAEAYPELEQRLKSWRL
jgi:predicted kinase